MDRAAGVRKCVAISRVAWRRYIGTNGKPSDGRKTTLPSQIGEFAADVAAGRVIVASVDD